MKQPELGKKIAELRKAKGLTQEELVEQCKLSVRTLQRIEAGEVAPRSYTLRTIFAALDYSTSASLETADDHAGESAPSDSNRLEQFYLYVFDLFNLKTNTMKKISILSVITVCTVLFFMSMAGRSEAQTSAKKAIAKTNKDFIQWFNAGQLDSVVAMYKDDACLEGRGCGKEFIREYYKGEMMKYKFGELKTADVIVKDNVATENGMFKVVVQGGLEVSGNYVSEWQLVNKRWVIVKDVLVIKAN